MPLQLKIIIWNLSLLAAGRRLALRAGCQCRQGMSFIIRCCPNGRVDYLFLDHFTIGFILFCEFGQNADDVSASLPLQPELRLHHPDPAVHVGGQVALGHASHKLLRFGFHAQHQLGILLNSSKDFPVVHDADILVELVVEASQQAEGLHCVGVLIQGFLGHLLGYYNLGFNLTRAYTTSMLKPDQSNSESLMNSSNVG